MSTSDPANENLPGEGILVLVDDDEFDLLRLVTIPEQVVGELPPKATETAGTSSRPKTLFVMPRLFLAFGIASAVLFASLFVAGWSYYSLPVLHRPFHSLHPLLRSSGLVGLSAGAVGTGLMVLNLSYLVRKRLLNLKWLGSLRSWMSFHVLTGLVGPALIVFHTAFAPQSSLGILSFAAMLVVVGAGVLGRYIYGQVPRSLEGRELELVEARQRLEIYRKSLLQLEVSSSLLESEAQPAVPEEAGGLLTTLVRVLYGDRESHREFRQLRRAVRSNRELRPHAKTIIPLLRKLCKERQWLTRYQELRSLMGAWRFLHRWLAILLFLVVLFHVVLAVNFGELWIFGGKQ